MAEFIFRTIEVRKLKLKKPTHITKGMVIGYHGKLRLVTDIINTQNEIICVLDNKFEVYESSILNAYNKVFKIHHNHGILTQEEVENYINKIR